MQGALVNIATFNIVVPGDHLESSRKPCRTPPELLCGAAHAIPRFWSATACRTVPFLAPFSLFAMVTAAWLRSCVAEALPTTFPPIISVKLLRPTHMYITDQQPEVRRDVWLKSFEESPRNMAVVWAKERRCPPMPTLRRLPRKIFLQSKQRE